MLFKLICDILLAVFGLALIAGFLVAVFLDCFGGGLLWYVDKKWRK